MKRFNLLNTIFGWVAFAIAAITYLLTIEPTASFWDCGEFIATAYKLDVGHPPGSPFFMLTGKFFSLFASDPTKVAMMINAMSAILSALTILFLFWTITHLAKKVIIKNENSYTTANIIGILGAGMVGALVYTFSDTFWFSAVEGEVYAYSSFFTAVVFWLILKWEDKADEAGSDRWLILIAYLMGLSISVHLLNLLTIPAIVLVYYFKKYTPSAKGIIVAMLVSVGILAFVLYGLIPGVIEVACWFELLFVNNLELPFNTGLYVYVILVIAILIWAIYETFNNKSIIHMLLPFVIVIALCIPTLLTKSWISIGLATIAIIILFMINIKKSIKVSTAFIYVGVILLKIIRRVTNYQTIDSILIEYLYPLILSTISLVIIFNFLIKKLDTNDSKFFNAINVKTEKRSISRILNTAIMMVTVMLIGYSSYAVIVIRSAANPPMDQNSPDNVFALKYYLNREQYGDTPLLYGAVYNAPVKYKPEGNICIPMEKKGKPSYAPKPKSSPDEKDKYIITNYKTTYVMDEQFNMLFPRMHSGLSENHISGYKAWGQIKGERVTYDACGQKRTETKPTFGENMRFFFNYQLGFMYWRYFMWNFSGRQNDIQGHGEIENGNWITGFKFIDNKLVGDQDSLPTDMKENKGRNRYYMLPLLLGILGILFQLNSGKEGKHTFWVTLLLFVLTGIAIVVYLNQTPYQPRERDYAYAGSFYAFSIWIGLGVLTLIRAIDKYVPRSVAAAAITVLCLGVPVLMATENWDDHDRSGRYLARDFGHNYLTSCKPNSIIFSNGDNDTFPLWYNQEVEENRTDIRVCNLSYLQTDWYIDQMKREAYTSEPLPISWKPKDYITGKNDVVWVQEVVKQPLDVQTVYNFVLSDDPQTKADGQSIIPTKQIFIPVNADQVIASGTLPEERRDEIVPQLDFSLGRRLTKSELMVIEMLKENRWKRPMYFAVTVGDDYYLGMKEKGYFELTGLAYNVVPVKSETGVNTTEMYDNLMNNFRYGNVNDPKVYIEENSMRMCRTHRLMFVQLVEALLIEGDSVRAKNALDYCEEMLPGTTIPYDYTATLLAQSYYELNEMESGDHIVDYVANNCVEHLNWYLKLAPAQRKSSSNSIGRKLAELNHALRICHDYDRKDLVNKYYNAFVEYGQKFNY